MPVRAAVRVARRGAALRCVGRGAGRRWAVVRHRAHADARPVGVQPPGRGTADALRGVADSRRRADHCRCSLGAGIVVEGRVRDGLSVKKWSIR